LVRILPGVEIQVVKEIVPQQLHPAGVVGLVGTAEKGPILMPTPVTSYREFCEKFGADTSYSLAKDARLCFLNGVYEVVASRVEAAGAKNASCILKDADGTEVVRLVARTPGEAGNNLRYHVAPGLAEGTVSVQLTNGTKFEGFENLTMDRASDLYLVNYLNAYSKLVTAEDLTKKAKAPKNPAPGEGTFAGGETAKPELKGYEEALQTLEMEEDIDIVLACDCWDPKVHALVDAHCMNMSKDAKNRIGIGTVAPGEKVSDIVKRTEVLASDRFVLVAPYGAAGAVAGLISRLNYYESPTFKAVTGIAELERRYTPSELTELVKAGVLALEARRGRGIIIEKGISTSKEQISVTRVADRAVRGVKNVAENFIGTLNTPGGRVALRQKLTEFLMTMEREEAIVPSVDGKEPPFLVDVYSSELDFAQGIVRVDLAVRPVRAMDYIYATITVQA
jgi:hypothetical protein